MYVTTQTLTKKALLGLSCHNHKDQYERIMVIETVVVDCSCQ